MEWGLALCAVCAAPRRWGSRWARCGGRRQCSCPGGQPCPRSRGRPGAPSGGRPGSCAPGHLIRLRERGQGQWRSVERVSIALSGLRTHPRWRAHGSLTTASKSPTGMVGALLSDGEVDDGCDKARGGSWWRRGEGKGALIPPESVSGLIDCVLGRGPVVLAQSGPAGKRKRKELATPADTAVHWHQHDMDSLLPPRLSRPIPPGLCPNAHSCAEIECCRQASTSR